MKQIFLFLSILIFTVNIYANDRNTDCIKKAEETFKTEIEACNTMQGAEKDNCIKNAQSKKDSAPRQNCRNRDAKRVG